MPLFYLLLSFFIVSTASAEEILRLVTGNDYPPYSDEKLPGGGLFTAKVTKILNKLQIKFQIDFMPWARGFEDVKKGTYTATFPYTYTEERAKDVLYLKKALISSKIYLYTHKKHKEKKSVQDFEGLIFCTPNGYFIEESIEKRIHTGKIKLQKQFDAKSCVLSVLSSKADFMILGSEHMRIYQNESLEIQKNIIALQQPLKIINLYMVFNKNTDKNLILKIEKGIENMKKE